jgi:hypothetical protein
MAQFGRPDSNVIQTNVTGGFTAIDESTASDADFAFSANNTTAELEVGLGDVTNPGSGSHVVRYRYAKTNAGTPDSGGSNGTLEVRLRQGATQIATSGSITVSSGTWTAGSFTLTGTEADSITDWTDLRIEFAIVGGGGSPSARRGVGVSWAELETPDVVSGVTGTGSVAFGFSTSASGTVEEPAFAGSGGVSFGFSLAGIGTFSPAPITGTGASIFGFSTTGSGDYTPAPITGTGSVAFTFATAGSGGQAVSGSGGVSFGLAVEGSGTVEQPAFTGTGGVAFGASTTGAGSFAPLGISGSGGVTFGFSTAGGVSDTGPWISHGTIHIGHPPLNH